MEYPVGLAPLADGLISNGGDCTQVIGSGATCNATETLFWNLETIPAGTGKTVSLLPTVDAATLPGSIIEFSVQATDSSGSRTVTNETVEVVNNRTLELAISEAGLDPAVPGGELSYLLNFGHTASSAVAPDSVVELPVPDGLGFDSATGGGSLVGNTVQWNLGTLQPGDVGERRVTFTVDSGQDVGTLIKAEAVLRSGSSVTRADSVTRVETFVPLQVAIEANANPVQPGEVLNVEVTVTNSSAFDRSNVQLRIIFPVGLAPLADGLLSNGGDCTQVIGSGATCNATETLFWNLETIPAGTDIVVTFPPEIEESVLLGT